MLDTMKFGLAIESHADTRGFKQTLDGISGVARAALKPITIPIQIARGGLGLLRDINLGLRPAVDALDRFLTRGAGLEGIQRAFGRQSGLVGNRAEYAARSLQAAALGTIRWGEAMRLANKGLSDNFSLKQIEQVFKFARSKATAEGEAGIENIAGGLLQALGMGSGKVLKQFGIDLGDVEESYARIKGAGAFDDLPFAERRAVIIAAAMEKMGVEAKRLKPAWNDTGILWQQIKTQVGDSVDKLTLSVVKSGALKNALSGVRDVLGGITRHFEQGGSFGELFFGKGKSGGLLGGLKAVFLDAGEALGKSILRGVIGAILEIRRIMQGDLGSKMISAGKSALNWTGSLMDELPSGGQWLVGGGRRFNERDRIQNAGDFVGQLRGTGARDSIGEYIEKKRIELLELFGTIRQVGVLPLLGLGNPRPSATPLMGRAAPQSPGLLEGAGMGMNAAWRGLIHGIQRTWKMSTGQGDIGPLKLSMGGPPVNPFLAMRQAVGAAAMGGFLPDFGSGIFDALQRYHDQTGGGDNWQRSGDWWKAFQEEMPGGMPGQVSAEAAAMLRMGINPAQFQHSDRWRGTQRAAMTRLQQRLRRISGGDIRTQLGRQAVSDVGAAIRQIVAQGGVLNPGDRQRMIERRRRQLQDEATRGTKLEISGIDDALTGDAMTREANRRIVRRRGLGVEVDEALEAQIRKDVQEDYRRTGKIGATTDISHRDRENAAHSALTAKNTGDINETLKQIMGLIGGLASQIGVNAAMLPRG